MRELHVTSPKMSGDDVLTLQKALAAAGYAPGPIDGFYGSTTFAAVEAFQAAHGLTVDGVVGDKTWTLLLNPTPTPVPIPTPRPQSVIGPQALAEAVKYLGIKELPPNSNKTQFGEWFGVNGVAWCNIFVSYCFATSPANYIICGGFKGAGVKAGKGCAYVPTTEAWLRASGKWVGKTEAQPGDIVIFNWDQKGDPEHIGIVESWVGGPQGQFVSIEGNTSVGNDSDGGEVMRRTRRLGQVDGFGRIL
jgi:hypothetical protein